MRGICMSVYVWVYLQLCTTTVLVFPHILHMTKHRCDGSVCACERDAPV